MDSSQAPRAEVEFLEPEHKEIWRVLTSPGLLPCQALKMPSLLHNWPLIPCLDSAPQISHLPEIVP